MHATVVYESMFGNTKQVAEAVADGISSVMPVDLVEVGSAPELDDIDADLVVVGAPTHAFGLSRESTRQDAGRRTGREVISKGRGTREWLDSARSVDVRVAAFDTHVKKPNLPGWASHAAERRLRKLGADVVTKAATFFVHGYEGPLYPGEIDRARAWGANVAKAAAAKASGGQPR